MPGRPKCSQWRTARPARDGTDPRCAAVGPEPGPPPGPRGDPGVPRTVADVVAVEDLLRQSGLAATGAGIVTERGRRLNFN